MAMHYDAALAHWQAVYTPTATGLTALPSPDGRAGFDANNFYVLIRLHRRLAPIWSTTRKWQFLVLHAANHPAVQIYNQWNDLGASIKE